MSRYRNTTGERSSTGEFHPASLVPGTSQHTGSGGHLSMPTTPGFRVIQDTPPGSPKQGLLEEEAQYATYGADQKEELWNASKEIHHEEDARFINGWTPASLRPGYWIPLVIFMILLGIGLELALYFGNRNNGWRIPPAYSDDTNSPMHYVYTLPPVIIAMILVALWAWSDIEIKKMQPYLDLLHGDSPPQKSLLLDYTRTNNFVVWISAFFNEHYMVALATLIGLLALVFQPVASAIFTTRETYVAQPLVNVSNLATVGLNQGQQFEDLTSFLSAAGFASSSVLFDLADPPFLHDAYTVAPFEIQRSVVNNGTIKANTTAVRTDVNCNLTVTQSIPNGFGGWTNHATYNNCTFSYSVNKSTLHLFGTDVMPDCGNTGRPSWFLPIVLWFFTYESTPPQGSATYCAPNISLWDVEVTVDIATGNLTNVVELGPLTPDASSSAAGVAALNGMAYNGVAFNLTGADQFVLARANATNLQLPASILQYAALAPGGVAGAFSNNSFTGLAVQVYTTYMKLVAKSTYFLPASGESIPIQISSFQPRLWLNAVAVHIGTVALFLVAIIGAFIQIAHAYSRRDLRLHHRPGTIASAVTIGAQTSLANLLHGQQEEEEIVQALRDKKFRMDPKTMKILVQGERGYEEAITPSRPGFFQSLRSPRSPAGAQKRFSRGIPASA